MSDEDTRVEAERRFSDIDGCPVAITQSQRDAFVAGAKWAREQVRAEVCAGVEAARPEWSDQHRGAGQGHRLPHPGILTDEGRDDEQH